MSKKKIAGLLIGIAGVLTLAAELLLELEGEGTPAVDDTKTGATFQVAP